MHCILFRESRHVALKIVKSARHYTETAIDEIELLKKVADTKPSAPGWSHVVQMYDSFKISGPHGTRILKYEYNATTMVIIKGAVSCTTLTRGL